MESYCHPFLSAFAGTCGGEYESSPCFSRPMLQCMGVKSGSLTVSGKVPKDFCTARIPHFSRTVSFPLLHSSSPVSVVSFLPSSMQVWFLNEFLLQYQLELSFLLFEIYFGKDNTAPCYVFCYIHYQQQSEVR